MLYDLRRPGIFRGRVELFNDGVMWRMYYMAGNTSTRLLYARDFADVIAKLPREPAHVFVTTGDFWSGEERGLA